MSNGVPMPMANQPTGAYTVLVDVPGLKSRVEALEEARIRHGERFGNVESAIVKLAPKPLTVGKVLGTILAVATLIGGPAAWFHGELLRRAMDFEVRELKNENVEIRRDMATANEKLIVTTTKLEERTKEVEMLRREIEEVKRGKQRDRYK